MKPKKNHLKFILLFLCSGLFFSCSTNTLIDDPEVAKAKVSEWETNLGENPKDVDALKNLSIYYVQTHQQFKAKGYLNRGLTEAPDDPALLFYKGLNEEFFQRNDVALNMYQKYPDIPEASNYKELMKGRYLWLNREKAYSDLDSLIKNEQDLSISSVSDSTLAVFPLIYQGTDKDYFPLSRGFSEMVSIDLAKVKRLNILERVRIQAVLDELKLSQSPAIEQSTAPRAGKLLRAGTIVSGDFDISNEKDFKINLGSWDVRTSERKSWVNESGELKDLFIIQKEIVFAFLEKNGIELTQKEKEDIAYIPTQNLQAFLSYSKGLLQEDAGNFDEAASFFRNAVEVDPKFNASKSKLDNSISISKSSGTTENFANTLKTVDPVIVGAQIQIVQNRSQSLQQNINSNFVQGVDSRDPAQEESNKRALDAPLPPPPPPPPRKK